MKPDQLALERAEARRDLIQDIFWMLRLSQQEEGGTNAALKSEVSFSPVPCEGGAGIWQGCCPSTC